MKILLCGEGPQDVGQPRRARGGGSEGWMQPLVRRVLARPDIAVDGLTRRDLTLLPRDRSRYRPLPAGHGGRALMAKLRALSGGYEIVVFMADADSVDLREFARKRDQILDGLNRGQRIGEVACVPISASESWLLSDASAWAEIGLPHAGLLPRRPERTWGAARDPDGHHPHMDFARACAAAEVDDGIEIRADLAARVDLSELRRKCPTGYGTFDDDLRSALAGPP